MKDQILFVDFIKRIKSERVEKVIGFWLTSGKKNRIARPRHVNQSE